MKTLREFLQYNSHVVNEGRPRREMPDYNLIAEKLLSEYTNRLILIAFDPNDALLMKALREFLLKLVDSKLDWHSDVLLLSLKKPIEYADHFRPLKIKDAVRRIHSYKNMEGKIDELNLIWRAHDITDKLNSQRKGKPLFIPFIKVNSDSYHKILTSDFISQGVELLVK